MSAAFASIEDRVNNAVIGRLGNAVLSIGLGAPVTGIFTREFVDASGIASSSPAVMLKDSDVPAGPVLQSLVISQGRGAGNWRIAAAEPDGSGVTTLLLERAA